MRGYIERARAGEAVVVSIILEDCGWSRHPAAKYQMLPPKGPPVRDTEPQRKAWHSVAEGLRQVLAEIGRRAAKE